MSDNTEVNAAIQRSLDRLLVRAHAPDEDSRILMNERELYFLCATLEKMGDYFADAVKFLGEVQARERLTRVGRDGLAELQGGLQQWEAVRTIAAAVRTEMNAATRGQK
jgi:hypothetical protein